MVKLKYISLFLAAALLLVGCKGEKRSTDDDSSVHENLQVSEFSEDDSAVDTSEEEADEDMTDSEMSDNETPIVGYNESDSENLNAEDADIQGSTGAPSKESEEEMTEQADENTDEVSTDESEKEQNEQAAEDSSDKPIELPFVPAE